MNEVLTAAQASARGFISPEDAKEMGLTKLDRTTLYRHAKAGKIESCLVEKGSRTVYWVLASALQANPTLKVTKNQYEALLEQWKVELKGGESPIGNDTIKLRVRYLRRFWEMLGEKPSIMGVNAQNLRIVLNTIKYDEEKRQDHISLKRHLKQAVSSFLKFLIFHGFRRKEELHEVYAIKLTAKQKIVREYVDEDAFGAALEFNRKWINGRTQYDVELMEMLISIYFLAGCRRAEAANIRLSGIDIKNDELKVYGKGGKERLVPLVPELKARVTRWINQIRPKNQSDYLLLNEEGNKVSRGSISKRFLNFSKAWEASQKNVLKKKKLKTHDCRRGYVVTWVMRGKPLPIIQDDVGHSDIRITKDYAPTGFQESKKFNQEFFNKTSGSPQSNEPNIDIREEITKENKNKLDNLKKSALRAAIARNLGKK